MKSELTHREALLVELVHELSKGTEEELGCSLEEIVTFLRTPIRAKDQKNALECLEDDGRDFLNQVLDHLRSS